ncbi:GGDEF domain-containing protein [Alkalimarinus alittae]|uniref:diguanylate cyclase n=1 Tax=Alkalimarinus alittae TaxID=2961619 RepID=A0ABY6N6Y5_9ALTE|nr:GGDEF domain-containing protein [Alkalimarinus alittae]UZE97757.1 GGDEF domain-containing protein [Alkalimarinus alittae]
MPFDNKEHNTLIDQLRDAQAYLQKKRFYYRFNTQMEAKYTQYMLSSYQFENRLYPSLGVLGLILFIASDLIVIPSLIDQAIIIRSIGAGIILAVVGGIYLDKSYRWHQILLCLGAFIIHLSLILVGILAADSGQFHYQFGSIITIIFICNIIRVGFSYALPFALVMLLSQLFAMSQLTVITTEQMTEIFFIYSFVTILSLIVNGRMEFEIRKSFVRSQLLNYEHDELIKTQEKLRKLSTLDALTGLFNRRYFNKHIEREWLNAVRQKTPISVLMIDVDDFKRYNDTQGHVAGDESLKSIAQTLKQHVQRPNDMVARYGGEEFVITLPYANEADATALASIILNAVFELNIQHPYATHQNRLTISIGCCSLIPDQEYSIKDLLKCADEALYESKRKGKNCISTGKCSKLNKS